MKQLLKLTAALLTGSLAAPYRGTGHFRGVMQANIFDGLGQIWIILYLLDALRRGRGRYSGRSRFASPAAGAQWAEHTCHEKRRGNIHTIRGHRSHFLRAVGRCRQPHKKHAVIITD
jgi:hypothetical protein